MARFMVSMLLALALALATALCGGCHWGVRGIYGCTGEQTRNESAVSCPRCGNSTKIDRLRVMATIPFVATEPIGPAITYHYYCQNCKCWWGAGIFGWFPYERGPGWPFKD